jgi:hypothetical protein
VSRWAKAKAHITLMKQALAIAIVAALAAPAGAGAAPLLAEPLPSPPPASSTTTPTTTATAPQQPPAYAPVDMRSDRVALGGYAVYLKTLLTATASARAAASSYAVTIVTQCRSALEPLTQPSTQIGDAARRTLTAIGNEIGDDLTISYDPALTPQFTRFAQLLLRLRWTRQSAGRMTVRRYVFAESRALALQTSNLCQDAGLAGASPQLLPPGTTSFLAVYNRASVTANRMFAKLTKLIGSYTRPPEGPLLQRIATLAGAFANTSRTDLLAAGSQLATALQST